MTTQSCKFRSIDFRKSDGVDSVSRELLFVGGQRDYRLMRTGFAAGLSMHRCDISELDERLRNRPHPGLLVSPVISGYFDCVDVAQILCFHAFRNRYRIDGRGLPEPAVICRDVRQVCKVLDFGILTESDLAVRVN